jgi:hypothetical protein
MGSDTEGELLDVRASGAALVRILYRELATVILLSLAWSLAALPLVTIGGATLALNETVTRVITDRSEDRLLGERDRVRAFARSLSRNARRGLPLSAFLTALLLSVWLHAQIYALSEQWIFSASTLVGLYFLVIGITWALRAASLLVRAPPEDRPGTLRAFRDGADLALEYPHFTGLQLLAVGAILILTSLKPVAVPLLFPATVAAIEAVAFEEITDRGAADIRQYYAEVE